MPKFRKKPVEVEAIQWTGDNTQDAVAFAGGAVSESIFTFGTALVMGTGLPDPFRLTHIEEGGWIVREPEVRMMSDDDFRKTYEPVEGDCP